MGPGSSLALRLAVGRAFLCGWPGIRALPGRGGPPFPWPGFRGGFCTQFRKLFFSFQSLTTPILCHIMEMETEAGTPPRARPPGSKGGNHEGA